MSLLPLLTALTDAWGPSGHEGEVRDIVRREVAGLADSVTVDPLGNLIAIRKPTGRGGRRVMVAAHLDEIGVIVSHIDAAGFARFQNIGTVNALTLVGSRVRFAGGVTGVIGVEVRREAPERVPALSDLFLDFGARTASDVPVRVGDSGAFTRPLMALPNGRIVAKALDDRVGVAVAIEVMRRLKTTPHEIAFAFTVQEEVGLRGAGPAAFGFEPEIALAIDVTRTGDAPGAVRMAVGLGKGAAIKAKDQGLLADPRLRDLLVARAEAAKIPYQLEVLETGRTDAAEMQLARGGAIAGAVSIPTRYLHTPSEMVDLGDVEACINLVVALLRGRIAW